ncbi:MAG: DNA polymerase/3'-5' exonuclease PolX [Patescibacteria group bacterium]|nr:DNA polymerase/3'-5' exonuclease PolX [Patescibacteria group bacterium]
MTNKELSQLLRNIAAAYTILGENRFKIIAYDKAAESIEHLTSEVKELWREGNLDQIPGIGKTIADHIDELFRTGRVKHFEDVFQKVPASVFPLLLVPGIGPKKAYRLVTEFHLQNPETVFDDLEKLITNHKIAELEGFGEKSEQLILEGLALYKKGAIKENRIPLHEADGIAGELVSYLSRHLSVKRVDVLGSLRRCVSTIGDIDIACIADTPRDVVEYFTRFPHKQIIDQGEQGATIILHNGRQVDMRVHDKKRYGTMLQYFTGSKHHNIHLRSYAQDKGLSLSEHGIKHMKTGEMYEYDNEEDVYRAIGLPWIPPELREDRGEIEAAIHNNLPSLVETSDIRGDLHMHTNYSFPTSHDIGASHIHDHLTMAMSLGYEYIGVADHNPKMHGLTEQEITKIMEARYVWYQDQYQAWVKDNKEKSKKKPVTLFILCEVDILTDGSLALPHDAFEFVDGVIVSLHSSFRQSRDDMTKRIIKALTTHEKVRIFGHPTGRLLLKREGVDADWKEVMNVVQERDMAMEINAYPDRLDLPDTLVRDAVEREIKLCIDTDSHEVHQMTYMRYGVAVARRGWAERDDIVNTMSEEKFRSWLQRI